MILGTIIEDWRGKNGLSLRQAAAMIGISHTCLYRLELGNDIDGPTLSTVIQWALNKGPIKPAPAEPAHANGSK